MPRGKHIIESFSTDEAMTAFVEEEAVRAKLELLNAKSGSIYQDLLDVKAQLDELAKKAGD